MLIMDDFFFPLLLPHLCMNIRIYVILLSGSFTNPFLGSLVSWVWTFWGWSQTSITTFSTWLNCSDYCRPLGQSRLSLRQLPVQSRVTSCPAQRSPGRLWAEPVEDGVFLLFRLSQSRDVNLLYSNNNSNKDDTQRSCVSVVFSRRLKLLTMSENKS